MAAILRQIRRWLSVGFVGIVTGVGSLIAAGDSATSRAGPQRASQPATQASGEEHFNSILNGRDLDD